jgi:tetratricopeptide (TPR) repeat protein
MKLPKLPKLSENQIFIWWTVILWTYGIGYEQWIPLNTSRGLITIFGNIWLIWLVSYLFRVGNLGSAQSSLNAREIEISDIKIAIQFKSDVAQASIERSFLKYELGDEKGAILECNDAIQFKPDFAQAYYFRGFLKTKLRDPQGAITDLNEAIRFKPDFAQAYCVRGSIKRELKNEKGALIDLQKGLDLFKLQSKE